MYKLNNIKPLLIASAFLLAAGTSQSAQNNSESCNEITSSQQILDCAKSNKTESDKILNKEYNDLLNRIRKLYAQDEAIGTEYIQKIKKSQRTWIKLRDENCEIESFEIEAGSHAYKTVYNNCITRETDQRTGYLKKISPQI